MQILVIFRGGDFWRKISPLWRILINRSWEHCHFQMKIQSSKIAFENSQNLERVALTFVWKSALNLLLNSLLLWYGNFTMVRPDTYNCHKGKAISSSSLLNHFQEFSLFSFRPTLGRCFYQSILTRSFHSILLMQ